MKTPIDWLTVLVAAVLPSASCLAQVDPTTSIVDHIVFVSSNETYGVECIIYGESEGSTEQQKVVTKLMIHDRRTREKVEYSPISKEAHEMPLFLTKDQLKEIWSPDGKYLVLPLGRTEGFQILQTTNIVNEVKKNETRHFIQVMLKRGTNDSRNNYTALYHTFDRWTSTNAFIFSAGLSEASLEFRYDVLKMTLFLVGTPDGRFVDAGRLGGLNETGLIPVLKGVETTTGGNDGGDKAK